MKLPEKIRYLLDNHMNDWLNTRKIVDVEISDQCSMFCVCGRLATGLHEKSCSRFNNKVNSETVKRLKHLWDKKSC